MESVIQLQQQQQQRESGMFIGKKITASSNIKVLSKPINQHSTKITQQVIAKETKQATTKASKNQSLRNAETKRDGQKTSKLECKVVEYRKKDKHTNSCKETEYIQESKQLIFKSEKLFKQQIVCGQKVVNQGVDKYSPVHQRIKVAQTLEKQESDGQNQLEGKNQFIPYLEEQSGESEEQVRKLPEPFKQIEYVEYAEQQMTQEKQIKQQIYGSFNMDIFSLEVDQIMSKQYFVL